MRTLFHDEKGFNILFIRAELDDYVLLPNEFRVYAHLARRAGVNGAYPAVESMARKCRLHEDTVRRCLGRLKELNLVKARPRKGCPTVYTLSSLSDWKSVPPENHASESPAVASDLESRAHHQKVRRKVDKTDAKTLLHGEKGFNILFIRSELDDYILTANEFRIYAHLARRAGNDWAWPSVISMARKCYLHEDTVRSCLRRLKELNLVKAHVRPGETTFYTLTSLSDWKPVSQKDNPSETEGGPFVSESSPPLLSEGTPPKVRETKGIPEGNPLKDNTAVGQKPSRVVREASLPKSSSTPIKRKAFAVADRLEMEHWDNCKVRYASPTAFAYALKALTEGHNETHIVKAYQVALHEAHGAATDEAGRGERHRKEKASPALTVWLARQNLGQDGRTTEERWHQMMPRLEKIHQRKANEDAQVEQEILKAAPAIAAWFEAGHPKAAEAPLAPSPILLSAAHPA